MGNVMGTILSGFGDIVGKLFGHPLDFCLEKLVDSMSFSCSSTCFTSWEFVSVFVTYFVELHGHKLLLTPRHNRRRRRHQKDIEEAFVDISSNSSESQGSIKFDDTKRGKSLREHRKDHMRKSLRPKSHHMQVQIVNDSIHHHKKKKFKNGPIDDHIRVSRRKKFAQKGMFVKGSTRSRRRV
uniref:Uncharacterized protein n=1 Tax=Solanum lycopersicum TaxID=4081 RepID=A0A3Q7ITA4_SOLLC